VYVCQHNTVSIFHRALDRCENVLDFPTIRVENVVVDFNVGLIQIWKIVNDDHFRMA